MRKAAVLCMIALIAAGCQRNETKSRVIAKGSGPAVTDYRKTIEEWRAGRVKRLTSDNGWLTVAGLFWLKQGANSVGSDPKSDIPLPEGKTPPVIGTITLTGTAATFKAKSGVDVESSGKRVDQIALQSDANVEAEPTTLNLGNISFYLIERGGKLAVRVKDPDSAERKNFKGIDSYPIDEKWRIEARFEPYNPPKKIPITNVLGMTEENDSPGAFVFMHDGKEVRIDPVIEAGSEDLFIMIRDATSGKETYGAGRYMYAKKPDANGKSILDFNKAYNPPCAFTRYATCPLPPRQNWLSFAVTAGEKKYH